VDTGWIIAAEGNVRAAVAHLKAATMAGQVLSVLPVTIVEARQRTGHLPRIDFLLSRLRAESILPEDGTRASELLREAGRQAGSSAAAQSKRVHEIGTNDALVAAAAERLGGIVYTADPRHFEWLRDAGAAIVVEAIPF
jgi:predicted nucleic acid-binding protein